MRTMQERAYEKRGEQYLLIKSPPASAKAGTDHRARQASEPGTYRRLSSSRKSRSGVSMMSRYRNTVPADWISGSEPRDAPGEDGGKVNSVGAFQKVTTQSLSARMPRFVLQLSGLVLRSSMIGLSPSMSSTMFRSTRIIFLANN